MRNYKRIFFGILLLIAGVIVGLNALGHLEFDLFFPGWWTLFIIIPCFSGLFTDKDKWGNVAGLVIGVALLFCAQGWFITYDDFWKLLFPGAIVYFALKMIVTGFQRKKKPESVEFVVDAPEGTVIFGGKEMNFDGQVFEGCDMTAVFGGIDCDLRGAIIEHDCKIKVVSIFGGVDILLPKGVDIKINSTNIFGGVGDNYVGNPDSPVTVYIETVSIFGGVDIE